MAINLRGYQVLTFDCYGTLIDWESGIWDALQPLLMTNGSAILREEALRAFATFETEQERSTPGMLYPDLLTAVHQKIAAHFSLDTNQALDDSFGASVPHWPAFPDTADALRILKQHYQAIYTAEDVGSYKPNPANFEYMLEHLKRDLGLEKSVILHTAQSMHHDHVPAKAAGLANAWIDRQRLSEGGNWGATAEVPEMPETDVIFFSMMEMAKAVQAA